MTQEVIGFTTVFGLFIIMPLAIAAGVVALRWLKLRASELDLRRQELDVERAKLEYLNTEAKRDLLAKLDQTP